MFDTRSNKKIKAPFPYFGGKRKAADIVWARFGDTLNYVEPFAGSLAVLLARPFPVKIETVNDADTYLANFWRATAEAPDAVAHFADWPVNEADLHARHWWLVHQDAFRERMMSDPDYYDPKIAGWWLWGISAWIGGNWCDVSKRENPSVQLPKIGGTGSGVHSQAVQSQARPHRRRPVIPMRGERGVQRVGVRQIPSLKGSQGVHSQVVVANGRSRPNLRPCQGINIGPVSDNIRAYMEALRDRLRHTRVVCGDWKRITGPSVTYKIGLTAVFLDPPYGGNTRASNLYAVDSLTIADDVRAWCMEEIEDGAFVGARYNHPKLRIALCGLDGEHNELEEQLGWDVVAWKANGGYGNQGATDNGNKHRERIWFSPHCLQPSTSWQGALI